jgi:nifR3 family TIM-barrel protein
MDEIYRSPLNRDVPPPAPGELAPLRIGRIAVWPPVVLAPMAGVTNPPFRTLCRRYGAGLYVSEMITARALVEGNRKTLLLASFGAEEETRSLQLYGVDPRYVGEAVRLLVGEGRVDHLDMNFGCPVRKVTSKGGGAAIPLKPRLLRAIVRAAVEAAGEVPVTLKFRIGIDDRYQTYLEAGRIGQEEGCAAVGLHARTAAQLYDGEARWDAIARLKRAVTRIPVLGNGDVWEAWDALRMMRTTGCDGVVVGRGCLGRPWFFRELEAAFAGRPVPAPPGLDDLCDLVAEHAHLLADADDERRAILAMRKHVGWYFHDATLGGDLRRALQSSTSLAELERHLDEARATGKASDQPARKRGPTSGPRRVALPDGWLEAALDPTPPRDEVMAVSG